MLRVSVGIVGPGQVGQALINQINSQAVKLRDTMKADLRIVGLTNSKKMYVKPTGMSEAWKDELVAQGTAVDLVKFGQELKAVESDCHIMVDCTASDDPPSAYVGYAKSGIHVVTPNKKFGAGPLDRFNSIKPLDAEFMYEATVGAGLPVISSLKGLIETGDEVIKIEGILSGTLSYIFNTYKSGMKFSDVVADAKVGGYTEPDPREDLSGMDVARKVTILARECGMNVELSDLAVESLVPAAIDQSALPGVDDYMARLPEFDDEIGARATAAEKEGRVIRYIGRVDVANDTCSVELTSVPKDHPFAQLSGTDNIIVFTTKRYQTNPLIIRGPGAGTEVTAAGIFSDILQVVKTYKQAQSK